MSTPFRLAPLARVALAGLLSLSALAVASSSALAQGPARSDDFNTCGALHPSWTLDDARGDALLSLPSNGTDAWLELGVPAGVSHDAWRDLLAPRVLQTVPDVDFTVTTRLLSLPTQRYQMAGILVEQDPLNWLRFDIYSDGNRLYAHFGATTNGASRTYVKSIVNLSGDAFVRAQRAGNTWTLSYSDDGNAWVTAGSRSHVLTVGRAGLFAGNAGTVPPAFNAQFDYLQFASDPLTMEDLVAPGPYSVQRSLSGSGSGAIQVTPANGPYACGAVVQLLAVPALGSQFEGWQGVHSGSPNPLILTIREDVTVVGTFTADAPPAIQDVVANVGITSARIDWTTNEPATSRVDFGLTSALGSSVQSATMTLAHSLTLPNLTPNRTYFYEVSSADASGNTSVGPLQQFTTNSLTWPRSDDFNTCGSLASHWATVDPRGDAGFNLVGYGTPNAHLQIDVPSGVSHDPWGTNMAPRVMQPAATGDFQATLRMETLPSQRFQSQGLIVHQDTSNWLRFDVYHRGDSLRAFAANTVNGSSSSITNAQVLLTAPWFLQVERVGNLWSMRISDDGLAWISVATFSRALTAMTIGPFAGNAGSGSNPAPAFTAEFDYFENRDEPLLFEDVGGSTSFTVSTQAIGAGSGTITRTPANGPYLCGSNVTLQANPAAGSTFAGWSGDYVSTANPLVITVQNNVSVDAQFDVVAGLAISGVTAQPSVSSARVTWSSNLAANSRVDYGTTPALGLTVSSATQTLAHDLQLSNLLPSTRYYYRARSVVGTQTAESAVLSFDTVGAFADTFSRHNLGSWEYVDPYGVGAVRMEGAGTSNAQLVLSIPSGSRYDPWQQEDALRVRRPLASPSSFDIAMRLDTDFTSRYQMQGILFENEATGGFTRLDIFHDGSKLRAFAATNTTGSPSTKLNQVVSNGPWVGQPIYLRVQRIGSTWTMYTSTAIDPTAPSLGWSTIGSFQASFTPTHLGLFAATSGNDPGIEARFDWITNVAEPIFNEDGSTEPDSLAPFAHRLVQISQPPTGLRLEWATDELATGSVRYGLTSAWELGQVSGGAPTFHHDVLLAGLMPNTVYHFGVTSTDSFSQVSTLDDFTFLTGSATSPVIDFWYTSALPGGGVGRRFGHLGAAQAFANVTGNVIDPDGFITSATYTVRLGTTVIESGPLVLGPDNRRLLKTGDFNVELQMAQLVAGNYTVTVSATDNNNNVSTEVIPVEITQNVVWPFGTVQFTGATPLQEQVRPVDGEWTVSNAGARTNSSATGYDRLLTLGDLSWTNYEVFGSFVVHSIEAPGTFPSVSGNPLVGIGVRWFGHAGNAVPRNGSWPTGAFAWFLWNPDHVTGRFRLHTNFYTNNVSQTAPMVLGDRYFYRVRVTQNGAVPQYVYSIWKTEVYTPGASPDWEISTPGVAGDPASGAVVLIAHHVDATFGDVTVTSLGQ